MFVVVVFIYLFIIFFFFAFQFWKLPPPTESFNASTPKAPSPHHHFQVHSYASVTLYENE